MKTQKTYRKHIFIGVVSFFIVLFTMPLGHALMILMEHLLPSSELYHAAFVMGAVGLILTIAGVFIRGETRQTLLGLLGGLLFWTGWIEFAFVYFAARYGVEPLIENGVVVTKPEYLIMPSSFGFWVMFMLLYLFSIKSGCNFFNYLQKVFFRKNTIRIKAVPITRHVALVTFMELNLMLWTSYLVLLLCYDNNFIGDRHPLTGVVAFGCLTGAFFMFKKLIRIGKWGYALRYSIATVIVFWTFVEVMGRWNILHEIWVHPLDYKTEMITMLVLFVMLLCGSIYYSWRRKNKHGRDKTSDK